MHVRCDPSLSPLARRPKLRPGAQSAGPSSEAVDDDEEDEDASYGVPGRGPMMYSSMMLNA